MLNEMLIKTLFSLRTNWDSVVLGMNDYEQLFEFPGFKLCLHTVSLINIKNNIVHLGWGKEIIFAHLKNTQAIWNTVYKANKCIVTLF